jgi:hypothetical protein
MRSIRGGRIPRADPGRTAIAGRRGCTRADNPYETDSRKAQAWIIGLLMGGNVN